MDLGGRRVQKKRKLDYRRAQNRTTKMADVYRAPLVFYLT